MCKKERGVLQGEMGKIETCDMERFDTLLIASSEKTIAILGDRWWPQEAKQKGQRTSERLLCNRWKPRNERPTVGGCLY